MGASRAERHESFTKWVVQKGGRISGIKPSILTYRGTGIIATRNIKVSLNMTSDSLLESMILQEGEEVAAIPPELLLTTDCIPDEFKEKHQNISVQGLLASFLAFASAEQLEPFKLWAATWPENDQFAQEMPIMLDPSLRGQLHTTIDEVTRGFQLLPPSINGVRSSTIDTGSFPQNHRPLLQKQEAKLRRDWRGVREVFPGADFERYRHAWLLVNTRSFYYDLPLRLEPKTHDDRMVLCAFLDYFNHADKGVSLPSNH